MILIEVKANFWNSPAVGPAVISSSATSTTGIVSIVMSLQIIYKFQIV
jgi:hypothetical protein